MFLYVAYALNPGEFYGFASTEPSFKKLPDFIKNSCEELFAGGHGRLDLASGNHSNLMVKLGNMWMRCSDSRPLDNEPNLVQITLIDAGRRQIKVPNNLPAVKMTRNIIDFKPFRFSLAGVEPVLGTSWAKQARDAFCALATGKVFQVPDYGSSRSITLLDIENGRSLANDLVNMGFAKGFGNSASFGETSNLPIEAVVFLERTGGLDVKSQEEVRVVPSAILKSLELARKK